jgi:hypothetical protein
MDATGSDVVVFPIKKIGGSDFFVHRLSSEYKMIVKWGDSGRNLFFVGPSMS